MIHISFSGRVVPAGLIISIPKLSFSWSYEAGRDVTVSCTIEKSTVLLDCQLSLFDPDDNFRFGVLVSDVTSQVQTALDAIAVFNGSSAQLVLDNWTNPDGENLNLAIRSPQLRGIVTTFDETNLYTELMPILMSEPLVKFAMNDLNIAISFPRMAMVSCGRAVDAIRNAIVGPGTEAKAGWPIMRDLLNIDKAYLLPITSASVRPRHGERDQGENADIEVVLERSWAVMNRALAYFKGGKAKLDPSTYPMLMG